MSKYSIEDSYIVGLSEAEDGLLWCTLSNVKDTKASNLLKGSRESILKRIRKDIKEKEDVMVVGFGIEKLTNMSFAKHDGLACAKYDGVTYLDTKDLTSVLSKKLGAVKEKVADITTGSTKEVETGGLLYWAIKLGIYEGLLETTKSTQREAFLSWLAANIVITRELLKLASVITEHRKKEAHNDD